MLIVLVPYDSQEKEEVGDLIVLLRYTGPLTNL